MRSIRRFTALSALALGLTTLALGVQPADAAAKKQTLHYFDKPVGFTYIPAGGKPTHKPPSGPPKAGDRIETTDNLYKGNHKHHGKKVVATAHTICLFDARFHVYCDSQVAVGSSMILAFSSAATEGDWNGKITGGTGRFARAKGMFHFHPVKDNADLTFYLK
jgi:hypothetical protein